MKVNVRELAGSVVDLCQGKNPEEWTDVMDAAIALLVKHGRTKDIKFLPRLIQEEWYRKTGTTLVHVATPSGLDKASKPIALALNSALGKEVEINESIDPTMLGGTSIAYDNERFDLSLRTTLRRLETSLALPIPSAS